MILIWGFKVIIGLLLSSAIPPLPIASSELLNIRSKGEQEIFDRI